MPEKEPPHMIWFLIIGLALAGVIYLVTPGYEDRVHHASDPNLERSVVNSSDFIPKPNYGEK